MLPRLLQSPMLAAAALQQVAAVASTSYCTAWCSTGAVQLFHSATPRLPPAPCAGMGDWGASPCSQLHQQQHLPPQWQRPAAVPVPESLWELPRVCSGAEPKKKLTLHRRGARRRAYHIQRHETLSKCSFCGQVGLPHTFFAGGTACTGACMPTPHTNYPPEYKPPC